MSDPAVTLTAEQLEAARRLFDEQDRAATQQKITQARDAMLAAHDAPRKVEAVFRAVRRELGC
jgi:hypothetical protein